MTTDDDRDNIERLTKAARGILKNEIRHLPLVPSVAIKLLKLTNDDRTKVGDLSKVIETEPILAAKVLRNVNSAAYYLPNKITSIKRAVNILGFSSVRRTALDLLFYNKLIKHRAKQKFNALFFGNIACLSPRSAEPLPLRWNIQTLTWFIPQGCCTTLAKWY